MTFDALTYGKPPGIVVRAARTAGLAALVTAGALVLFGSIFAGTFLMLAALCGGAALALVTWQWPTKTVIVLVVLIPLARFMSFVAFAMTHSNGVLRASQLWKDEVIVILAVRMIHEQFVQRRSPRLHLLDVVVGAFMLLVALYFLYPGSVAGSSIFIRALALRQDALYLLAYFVGRSVIVSRDNVRTMLQALIVLSVVVSVVAVFEFIAPRLSNGVLDRLGYQQFTAAVGTPNETQLVRSRILPSGDVPRASSLFLADLGLAFYQVLLIPLAGALFFSLRRRLDQLWAGAFVIGMIGTIGLTLARAPVVGAAIGLLVLVIVTHSFVKTAWLTLGVAAAGLVFLVFSGLSFHVFSDLLSSNEASASAHARLISNSLHLVWSHPWGLGLGNGSHVSMLAAGLGEGGLPNWATETWYLQMGLEMGVLAMLLFAGMLLLATCNGLLSGLHVSDVWLRALCLGTAGAGAGLLFVSAYHPVWSATHVTFLFWLFTGIAVRACRIESAWPELDER
jgi:hypothetical protein